MKCRLCNSNDLEYFYSQGDKDQFKYYVCRNCELVNLDLDSIEISENQEKYSSWINPDIDYEKIESARSSYQFIKDHVNIKGSYLDIGCGRGALLYFARNDNWDIHGLELLDAYKPFIKEKLGIDISIGNFLEFNDNQKKYDLVSLRHVLEHLPDSILALNKISDLLKDNSYAHLEFPNIKSLHHRIQRSLTKKGLHKKKYASDYLPGHCNEFSKESFKFLLDKTGFELIRWETYSHKSLSNFIYNNLHIGTKARAIIKKK